MAEWFTRQQVAELLGISKATVYHYAKQRKIHKIPDPHRTMREARYEPAEVLALAEERKRNQPTGTTPSKLAKKLGISKQKVYSLINENDLEVDVLPLGDERTIYSIPEKTVEWIKKKIEETAPTRGARMEFYEADYDIALYQKFRSESGQEVRVSRNEENEWGFHLSSRSWIPYEQGINEYQFKSDYAIHRPVEPVKGYTDFLLPLDNHRIYDFLDYMYQIKGIENIRLREHDSHIALSVKSGRIEAILTKLSFDTIKSFLVSGDVTQQENIIIFESGYTRTTFDLPKNTINEIRTIAETQNLTMSEFVELAVKEKIDSLQKIKTPEV